MSAPVAPATPQRPPEAGLGPVDVRELPEPPPLRKMIGPSIVLVGVALSSGEYIIWPFIASQAGLVFLWGAVVGVLAQFFLNMEIERYTLATGETAVNGFQRLWKPLGLLMCACALAPNIWPAWATSSATILTYIIGAGNPTYIAVGILLAIGVILTTSPVIYRTLERIEFVKVGATLLFLVLAALVAISATAWGDLDDAIVNAQIPTADPLSLGFVLGALAYAGAGGTNNLVQSNWIRDKGYGMGLYAPRLVSPITGQEEAAPSGHAHVFDTTDPQQMERWRRWWRSANQEQFLSFACIGIATIVLFSLLAYSTVYGRDLGEASGSNFDFIEVEGQVLGDRVGEWFKYLFWGIGVLSLFGAALGILDYVSRLVADVLKVGYLRESATWSEGRIYFTVAWSMIAFGIVMLLSGFDQPLGLVALAATLSGMVMFVYSGLLIVINRRFLPRVIGITPARTAAVAFCFLGFGVFTVLVLIDQARDLL